RPGRRGLASRSSSSTVHAPSEQAGRLCQPRDAHSVPDPNRLHDWGVAVGIQALRYPDIRRGGCALAARSLQLHRAAALLERERRRLEDLHDPQAGPSIREWLLALLDAVYEVLRLDRERLGWRNL